MKVPSEVAADFDRIALAAAARQDRPGIYDEMALALIPTPCQRALDIGCGTGRFTRALARRAAHVTAIDISPEMLREARKRTTATNVEYRLCDARHAADELGSFDCVVSLAAFHHLPVETGAAAFKAAVAPGGTLILQDLWRVESFVDRMLDFVRLPVKTLRLLQMRQPLIHTAAERAAWREHERADYHLTPREVAALRERHFPGAAIQRHFLWRYTLVWRA